MPTQSETQSSPFGHDATHVDQVITELVHTYSATLYRVAYSVLRNSAEAEDAVQEAFLRVLKHRDKIAGIRDKRVWLARIAWNVAIDKTRRRRTRPESEDIADYARVLPAAGHGIDVEAIGTEARSRIFALVDQLPAKEREVLLLSAVEELAFVEIAAVLKTTPSAVRSRIFRARKLLRAMIEADGDPSGLPKSRRMAA